MDKLLRRAEFKCSMGWLGMVRTNERIGNDNKIRLMIKEVFEKLLMNI